MQERMIQRNWETFVAARWSFKRRNLQWRFYRRNLHKKQPQLSHLVNLCLTNCPVARQTSCFVAFKLTAVILLFLLHNIPNLSQISTCYLFLIVLFCWEIYLMWFILILVWKQVFEVHVYMGWSNFGKCLHWLIKFHASRDMFQNNSSKCMHGLIKF